MKRQSIDCPIGFSDGQIESYCKKNDAVEVMIKAWNERRIRVTLESVVYLLDNNSGDIEDFCEVSDQTTFLRSAIASVYEVLPAHHPYRHFQFVGVEGNGVLDIVAESISVEII